MTAVTICSDFETQENKFYHCFHFSPSICQEVMGLELRVRTIKKQDLAPDSWDAYKRNDFSKPDHLHFPIHRRALDPLIWEIWFSLINSNLLILRLPAPCYKLLYSLAPPLPLGISFLGSPEMLSPGLEVLMSPTKQISQLLGHMYLFFCFFFFFSWQSLLSGSGKFPPTPLEF